MPRDPSLEDGGRRLTDAAPFARHGLPQHDADRVQVAAHGRRFAEALLRRCVPILPFIMPLWVTAMAPAPWRSRSPQLHASAVGEDDVRGRDVPMNDVEGRPIEVAKLMRIPEPCQDLGQDPDVQLKG